MSNSSDNSNDNSGAAAAEYTMDNVVATFNGYTVEIIIDYIGGLLRGERGDELKGHIGKCVFDWSCHHPVENYGAGAAAVVEPPTDAEIQLANAINWASDKINMNELRAFAKVNGFKVNGKKDEILAVVNNFRATGQRPVAQAPVKKEKVVAPAISTDNFNEVVCCIRKYKASKFSAKDNVQLAQLFNIPLPATGTKKELYDYIRNAVLQMFPEEPKPAKAGRGRAAPAQIAPPVYGGAPRMPVGPVSFQTRVTPPVGALPSGPVIPQFNGGGAAYPGPNPIPVPSMIPGMVPPPQFALPQAAQQQAPPQFQLPQFSPQQPQQPQIPQFSPQQPQQVQLPQLPQFTQQSAAPQIPLPQQIQLPQFAPQQFAPQQQFVPPQQPQFVPPQQQVPLLPPVSVQSQPPQFALPQQQIPQQQVPAIPLPPVIPVQAPQQLAVPQPIPASMFPADPQSFPLDNESSAAAEAPALSL